MWGVGNFGAVWCVIEGRQAENVGSKPNMTGTTKGPTLELSAALWALGLLTNAEMAEAVEAAVKERPESLTLRRLAAHCSSQEGTAEGGNREEADRLWVHTLEELQMEVPEPPQALLLVAKHYAAQVVDGGMEPYACAKMLWRLQLSVMQFPEELLRFIGFAGAWDAAKTPAKRLAVEKKIVEESRRLMDHKALTSEAGAE